MQIDIGSIVKIIESLGTVGILAVGVIYLWKERAQIVNRLTSLEDYQTNKMENMVVANAESSLKLADALTRLTDELNERPCASSAYHEIRGNGQ